MARVGEILLVGREIRNAIRTVDSKMVDCIATAMRSDMQVPHHAFVLQRMQDPFLNSNATIHHSTLTSNECEISRINTSHHLATVFPCLLFIPSNFLNKLSCSCLFPAQACCIFRIVIDARTANPTVLSECFFSRDDTSGVIPISSSSWRSILLLCPTVSLIHTITTV